MNAVRYDAGELFAGRKSGTGIAGYDAANDFVPASNPGFIVPRWGAKVISWFAADPEPLWLSGPTGSGKSALVRWIASKLNYPVYEITGHARLELQDLTGGQALVPNPQGAGATTAWVDGPLTRAMRTGGIFLLNEIDLVDPAILAGLNTILDGAPLLLVKGVDTEELVSPHAMFRFIATANSNGSGDDTGVYTGVLRQNFAFQTRFVHLLSDYLPVEAEKNLINSSAALPPEVVGYICKFTEIVRGACTSRPADGYESYSLSVPMSTRTLVRWAQLARRYEPMAKQGANVLREALDDAIGNACDSSTRAVMHEILQRVTGRD